MPKNIEDIIVPERDKKSIRDIPIPDSRRKVNIVDAFSPKDADVPPPPPPLRSRPMMRDNFGSLPSNRRYSKKSIWIGAGIAIVVLIAAIFSLRTSATLTYVPKSVAINFTKDVYTAHKNTENQLLFSVIKLSGEKGLAAPASGEVKVSRKAQGTIIVYNENTQTQKLVKTTRFQTPEGKIYRVGTDIVVPAQKMVEGKPVPGSLEIVVVADQPGDTYNIPLSDFTLPGLKGDKKVYARSKTPMTGGFIGTEKAVSADDAAKAKTSLEASLKTELLNQANAQVPADYILFPNLVNITYEDLPQSNQTNSGATINERGNFYGVMFRKKDLAAFLAQKKAVADTGMPVDISDLSSLDLSFVGQPQGDLLNAEQISFQVSGGVTVTFVIDEEALKNDLSGTKRNEEDAVLKKYPGIVSADAVLRPFWNGSFPEDVSKIKIVKNLQK
ncbi:MAG: hypothetical protein ACYC1K_01090 [Minisyncoccota bacterium]